MGYRLCVMSLDNLQLSAEFVPPDYSGGTIANIPATIAGLLGVPFAGLPPLPESLWRPLGDARRVVLFIVDALGWNLCQQEQAMLSDLTTQAIVQGRLTSIFPSTTVAALSSLWTGLGPAQHGMVGLRLFMPQYAVTAQTLSFSPTFGHYPQALIHAGLKPESFLHGSGFAEQLADSGVASFAFKGQEIVDSALSKMHGRGLTASFGVYTLAEMFVQLRQLLEEKAGKSLYANVYWPTIDTLSHLYGWEHPTVAAELRAIFTQLRQEIFGRLSLAARKETVFLLAADHGQVTTTPAQRIYLEDHPDLQRWLWMIPAGEPRTPYLYVKNGRQTAVLNYIADNLSHAMVAMPAATALSAGLLGPEPHAPEAADRLGDVLLTMRDGFLLLTEKDREKADRFNGRHGGMTAPEMYVPWWGFRLDG
jgi:hypothetical protein